MASIYGVELKSVKTWEGTEGMGLQANVYIDKKLAGQVTDDAWGGDLRYDFDTTEFDKRADKYRKNVWAKKPENAKYTYLYKSGTEFKDQFIDEIFNLREAEKAFKKAQKTQWPQLVKYKVGANGVMRDTACVETVSDVDLVKLLAQQHQCTTSEIVIEHRYKDASEFVIA